MRDPELEFVEQLEEQVDVELRDLRQFELLEPAPTLAAIEVGDRHRNVVLGQVAVDPVLVAGTRLHEEGLGRVGARDEPA